MMAELREIVADDAAAECVHRVCVREFDGQQTVDVATGLISFLAVTMVNTALHTENPYGSTIEIRDSWVKVLHEYVDMALDRYGVSRPS